MAQLRKVVGIDLGTTNSVIALLDATDNALLVGQDARGRTFPSLVAAAPYDPDRLLVGRGAAERKGKGAVASVKRFMGLDRRFTVGNQTLSPPETSAHILRHLRDVLAASLNDRHYVLDAAVITMPAYFNHNQIEATRKAGELAGFEVVELLHEPTAAAIYYAWAEGHGDATYLVYDLGGGTFDVSVIRKRFGDYEVLSVSGDPFLGGDDFDRRLATHLQEHLTRDDKNAINFDLNTAEGTANFAQLLRVAEGIKIELSERDLATRHITDLVRDLFGRSVTLEITVERGTFEQLIRDQVDRTIDFCDDALHRAHDKAQIRLADVDYVILVGGSSRIPLVRQTVLAAFGNPERLERVRHPEPLLHEPDLCVAYGAALRGATHGLRFLELPGGLELHVTSQPRSAHTNYTLTGAVQGEGATEVIEGGSVRVRAVASGLVEEAFLDVRGGFALDLMLHPECDNALEVTVCDAVGSERVAVPFCVRHAEKSAGLGQAVLPTQLITRPLQIDVLDRARQRVRQVLAPVGAPLPHSFAYSFRTVDQSGRIVLPLLEDNRVIKQVVIDNLDPELPVGTPVEVALHVDVKHNLRVEVSVSAAGRKESVSIEAPPPPQPPTGEEITSLCQQIEEQLGQLDGTQRTGGKMQFDRALQDLHEALRYEDEPRAIQRMAELRDLLDRLRRPEARALEPPWKTFAQLVKECLILAGDVAERTGRERQELFEQVYAQERFAEQAFAEHNQALYGECFDNLHKFGGYLQRLGSDHLPGASRRGGPPTLSDARSEVHRLLNALTVLASAARSRRRADVQERAAALNARAEQYLAPTSTDPIEVLRQSQRLWVEYDKLEAQLSGRQRDGGAGTEGLLEGTL
jgi:molecular chaperone DnaK